MAISKSTRQVKGSSAQASDREVVYRDGSSDSIQMVLLSDDQGDALTVDATEGLLVQMGPTDNATLDAIQAALEGTLTVTGGGGGTEYTEDAAAAANPVGTTVQLVRADTPATVTDTDGDNVAQRGTNYGAAYSQIVDSSGNFVDSFGGGTQYAEDSGHTTGDSGTAMLGVYKSLDDQGVDADTTDDYAIPHIDARGRLRVSPGSLHIIDNFSATTGWTVLNDDAGNIATNLNHVLAANSLEFDKLDGTSNTTDAIIQKTVTSFNAFNLVTGAMFLQGFVNLPDVTNVVNYIVRLGTDSSNYNEWRVDATGATANQWEVFRILVAKSTGFSGNGVNLTAVTYCAVGVEFSAQADTLANILWDGLLINSGQVNDVDVSAEGSADVRLSGYKTNQVDTNQGNASVKTLRVAIADDDTNLAAILADTAAMDTNLGTVAGAVAAGQMQVDIVADGAGLLTTSAHDAAFGTAGAADAQVRTVQGVASMTPLLVDGSAVTQPVSGTVTANPASGTITTVSTVTAVTDITNPIVANPGTIDSTTDVFFYEDLDETEEDPSATAITVYGFTCVNLDATPVYIQFFNTNTVTVGTTSPEFSIGIPSQGDANGAGIVHMFPRPVRFDTALSVAATTTPTGAGGPGLNEVVITLFTGA